MLPTHLSTALALSLVGLVTLPQPIQEPQGAPHFPVPDASLLINSDQEGRLSMEDLLDSFSSATGQQIHVSQSARNMLAQIDVGLLGEAEVPGSEIYSFVENLLFQNNFVMAELRSEEPRLLGIHSLSGNESSWISRYAEVPGTELEQYVDHPALLVQSVVEVSPLDARHIVAALRPLMRHSSYQSLLNVGDGNSIIMRGTGSDVAGWAALLETAVEQQEAWIESLEQEDADPRDG